MMAFDAATAQSLRRFFHQGQILGPTSMDDVQEKAVRQLIFDFHKRVYERGNADPSLIVGRRGAGKTAYLQHIEDTGRFNLVVRLKKDEAMSEIIQKINTAESTAFHVEQIGRLWTVLLNLAIVAELVDKIPQVVERDSELIKLKSLVAWANRKGAIGFIRRVLLRASQGSQEGILANIIQILASFLEEDVAPAELLQEVVSRSCSRNKLRILIAIDSLEEYDIREAKRDVALKGFMKAVGRFNNIRDGVTIRCCLPSEMHAYLLALSSNANKDFPKSMTLHWRSGELMALLAHRIAIHMELYRDGPEELVREALAIDRHTPDGPRKFLDLALGAHVQNESGSLEPTILFILRHTHMIPRQLFMIVASAMQTSSRRNRRKYFDLDRDTLMSALAEEADNLKAGVVSAFQFVHHGCEALVNVAVANLPTAFDEGDFDAVYSRRLKGSAACGSRTAAEVLQILVQVGAIGRVITSGPKYIRSVFEYNARVPDHSSSATYCVHPLFRIKQSFFDVQSGILISMPVHPIGADPHDDNVVLLR